MNAATRCLPLAIVLCSSLFAPCAEIEVPAHTAYIEPEGRGARVSSRSGITRWRGPEQKVLWFGEITTPGPLRARVRLRLGRGATSHLRLSVAGGSREASVTGAGPGEALIADFGSFEVRESGYQRIRLEALDSERPAAHTIEALLLDGPATEKAHFNLEPRRNAASVHLMYPTPREIRIEAFHCEVTAVEDPLWTFYMACGWHRGYFGMQVNSPTERRIIFSVWDSGGEPVDRDKVAKEDRVELVDKGEGVVTNDFGNEGTGGHSHLVHPWKTGEPQRFLVTARPVDATHTIYSGYYFRRDQGKWMLISAWKAPKDGGYLRRLHSFSENFAGRNGHLRRKALYGSQWAKDTEGRWFELTTARFSHDPTGRSNRLDRFMGVEDGRFFLSHGGFVAGRTDYGTSFRRPPTEGGPAKLGLPKPLPTGTVESAPGARR